MGNWRRVQIVGTCDSTEVAALRKALAVNMDDAHCLMNGGLMGLPNWAGKNIDAVGNLFERGYGFDDIQETLQQLAIVAPSLNVTVHVGPDHEGDMCLVSVVLLHGKATIEPARVKEIPEIVMTRERAMESLQQWR